MKIYKYEKLDSTNIKVMELINKNNKPPFLVITEEQTEGVGRNNKKYFCPKGGIWMTFIDKFDRKVGNKYSLLTSLAILKVLEDYNIKAKIKWPNDIYFNNKKVAGILIKIINPYVLIGVGINTNVNKFPLNLKNKCSSIFIEKGILLGNELFIKKLIRKLKKIIKSPTLPVREIENNLIWIGEKVKIYSGGKRYRGVFKGITKKGYAVIDDKKFVDGHLHKIN